MLWPVRRWALGVLIFEVCSGLPPFYCDDRLAMYQRTVHLQYTMPSHFSKVSDCWRCLARWLAVWL